MARIRSVKPEFWLDPKITRLSRDARLLYIALWNASDEHGRLLGDPRVIKGHAFPYDDDLPPAVIDGLIDELEGAGKLRRYAHDGEAYLHLPNLSKHQRLEPKVESRLPAPPDPDKSAPDAEKFAPDVQRRGEVVASLCGREQVAGGAPRVPAPRCPTHAGLTDDPPSCRACGDARREFDAYLLTQKQRPTTAGLPPAGDSRRCDIDGHETELATHCRICASERKSA